MNLIEWLLALAVLSGFTESVLHLFNIWLNFRILKKIESNEQLSGRIHKEYRDLHTKIIATSDHVAFKNLN